MNKWESYALALKKKKKQSSIFSLARNIIYWLLRGPCFEFWGDGKHGLFEPKGWWKYDIYWLLEISCFEIFGDGKHGLFLDKKFIERWYLLITEKFLFWATEKLLFWIFLWWEIQSIFSQKFDIKIIYSQVHHIPGPGKYVFSPSVYDTSQQLEQRTFNKELMCVVYTIWTQT